MDSFRFPVFLVCSLWLLSDKSQISAIARVSAKPSLLLQPANCYREVPRCRPLNSSFCLDVQLPYRSTAVPPQIPFLSVFENDSSSTTRYFEFVQGYLEQWKGLRSIPQCWKALQLVLCASIFPQCENEYSTDRLSSSATSMTESETGSQLILPTSKMCHATLEPCRAIDPYFEWPEFLRCQNETLFPKCNNKNNQFTALKVSDSITESRCLPPLVSTDDRRIYFGDFDGCALHCINPIYSEDQHNQISKIIAYGGFLSLIFTSFALGTFLIDRACLKRRFYTLIVFYMNFCMLFSALGWMLQFFKSRPDIVCRSDNTTRYGEPSKSDHFYCCLSFFLIYYFSFAALIWFIHLFRVFYQTFHGLSTGIKTEFNRFHFHMSAWSIPLIMTMFILVLGEIDADSLRGICFVGTFKPWFRFVFVLIPLTTGIAIGMFHAIRTVRLLFQAQRKCENASLKRKRNIYLALVRVILFIVIIAIIYLVTTGIYLYELYIYPGHLDRFKDHLICNLNISGVLAPKPVRNPEHSFHNATDGLYSNEVSSCPTYEPPDILLVCIQLAAIFCTNILASSWVWTRATIATWKRFLRRHIDSHHHHHHRHDRDPSSGGLRLKPYELIANSYGKREQIQQGLYIPSWISNHNDPVDMDLNSAQSQSVSATFQQNFVALLNRRYAICGNNDTTTAAAAAAIYQNGGKTTAKTSFLCKNNNNNSISGNGYSYASQNHSVSDVSQHQVSFDSIEQIEMTIRNQRRKTKKEREKLYGNAHRMIARRGSDTSGSMISGVPIRKLPPANTEKTGGEKPPATAAGGAAGGDLFNMLFGGQMGHHIPPPTATTGGMIPSPVINHPGYNPYITPMMVAPSGPFVPTPSGNFQQKNPPLSTPVRMAKSQCVSNFSFTHGMSDQMATGNGGTMVNPLMEKRRPDSNMAPNIMDTKHSNFVLNTLATNHSVAPMFPAGAAAAAVNFVPSPYLMATGPNNGYPAAAMIPAAIHHQHQQRYYNTQAAFLAYQQTKNLWELENYLREHEKFKSIITAHASDSEASCYGGSNGGDILPIQLTESDTSRNGYYSDDHHQLQTTKMLVQERMKQVEDRAAAEANPTNEKNEDSPAKK